MHSSQEFLTDLNMHIILLKHYKQKENSQPGSVRLILQILQCREAHIA
jgi:hypothetical protein